MGGFWVFLGERGQHTSITLDGHLIVNSAATRQIQSPILLMDPIVASGLGPTILPMTVKVVHNSNSCLLFRRSAHKFTTTHVFLRYGAYTDGLGAHGIFLLVHVVAERA